MNSLTGFTLNEGYKRIQSFGDKLADLGVTYRMGCIRPIIGQLYNNHTDLGGRPNTDEVLLL